MKRVRLSENVTDSKSQSAANFACPDTSYKNFEDLEESTQVKILSLLDGVNLLEC